MSAFNDSQFLGVYPISFLMRQELPRSWFRIHSLPESKRYPETSSEWNILMERHQEFSSSVLGEGSPCQIYYSLFEDSGVPDELLSGLQWSKASMIDYEDDQRLYTYAASSHWCFDDFRKWIRLRSDDEIGWLSFHSMSTDAIYSPYDGGADAFSLDSNFVEQIRAEFTEWRSPHPMGL